MRNRTAFAVIMVVSLVGCGSNAGSSREESIASAEEALSSACNPGDPNSSWCNGGNGWQNGGNGWQNGGNGWQNGGNGWQNGHDGWTGVWSNGATTGWASAWTSAWGGTWTNGWSFAGKPTFAWTEPQTCAHPLMQTGGKLSAACNPVVTLVCNELPYCCTTGWTSQCVGRAMTVSAPSGTYLGCYDDSSALTISLGHGLTIEQCVFEAQGRGFTYAGMRNGGGCYAGNTLGNTPVAESECNMTCIADPMKKCGSMQQSSVWQVPGVHAVSMVGGPLDANHSACAAAVIAELPSCGTDVWDEACVAQAAEICVERYVTRPRIEEDRNVVDTCIETKIPGYPACPIAGSGPTGKECCRRALALKGSYQRATDVPGYGRQVQWELTTTVDTPFGSGYTINSSLFPDPCVTDFHGRVVCGDMHHMWQAAGPEGTVYPDCSGTRGARPCGTSSYGDQLSEFVPDAEENGVETMVEIPYRGILVATMSALLTTNDHYWVDVLASGPTQALPRHPEIQADHFEARWSWSGAGVLTGRPVCLHPNAPQRTATDPSLVAALPTCYLSDYGKEATHIVTLWAPN